MRSRDLLWMLAVLLSTGSWCCSPTWVRQAESGVPMSANAALLYGEIDGFTQIPRGGQPGTTSAKRPTRPAVLANASRER